MMCILNQKEVFVLEGGDVRNIPTHKPVAILPEDTVRRKVLPIDLHPYQRLASPLVEAPLLGIDRWASGIPGDWLPFRTHAISSVDTHGGRLGACAAFELLGRDTG